MKPLIRLRYWLGAMIIWWSPSIHANSFDGHWFVEMITCNGEAPNEATRSLYTPPNFITVFIEGNRGAFLDILNGCQLTIPLRVQFSKARLDATFDGPITCKPTANCDPRCGLDLPVTVSYDISFGKGLFFWRSIGPTDDNCARGGQSPPVLYTMRRRE